VLARADRADVELYIQWEESNQGDSPSALPLTAVTAMTESLLTQQGVLKASTSAE